MNLRSRCRALQLPFALGVVAVLLGLCLALPVSATTLYPDFVGTDVTFTGIQETSTAGDPEPLFGAPTGSGNQLLFFPLSFSANTTGAFGFDQTSALFNTMISGNTVADTIEEIRITEFGDTLLTGVGTAATGTFAGMGGTVTVTETTSGPITPVIIPWTGVFSPSDTLLLPGDLGTTLWTGSVVIDVASVVPNATKVTLAYDNDLFAFSEAGTTAKIQKKVVSGPVVRIQVVPEPTTLALLGTGLLGLALRARSGRTHRRR